MSDTIRTLSRVFLTLAVTVGCLVAQMPPPDGPPPDGPPDDTPRQMPAPPNAKQALLRYSKALKLSDDQVTKIKPILAAEQRELDVLRKSDASRDEQFRKFAAIEEKCWAAVRPVLNDAQQKKFDAMTRKMTDRRDRAARSDDGDDMPPPPPDGPPPGGGGPPPL